jgi:hypothetical protein
MPRLQQKVKIEWSSNFAYAIGLITSDGNLCGDGRHMSFASSETELIEKFKQALALKNAITPLGRGGEKERRYFQIRFGDKVFYEYLYSIGLTSRKSKTIKAVDVPAEYFSDFLRGVFDGDGSFSTDRDKRWPKSFRYVMSFASASFDFVRWLHQEIASAYGTKGFIRRGDGVYEIRYTKTDTRKLFAAMYQKQNILFLRRKYIKMKTAFLLDQELHPDRQKVPLPW